MRDDDVGEREPEAYWRVPEQIRDLSAGELEQLKAYHSELLKFNRRLNLISRRGEVDADMAHIADCVLGSRIILAASSEPEIFDIGSGNGLPGIVLAILAPKRRVVCVDSDERKLEFQKILAGRIGLRNCSTLKARFEDLPEGSVRCGTTRGFASLTKCLLLARKCVAESGTLFHLKSSGWVREVAEIPTQLCSFWEPKLVGEYIIPILNSRMAVVSTHKIA